MILIISLSVGHNVLLNASCPTYLMNNIEQQFSAIYDQCVDRIYRFVFIKVSSQEIAEDLTSETFLKGWEAFKKHSNPHPKAIDNPSAFLYKIARNLVIDYYRGKGKLQSFPIEYAQVTDPKENLEEKAILGSDLNMVQKALAVIKDEYREVIVWHYLDELNIPEIAKIVNKSEGTVRVTLHRALNSLRSQLDSTGQVKEV